MCKETDLSGETLPLLQPLPSMFAAPAPWFFSGEGYRENMGSSAPFGHFILVPMQCDIQMESRAFYYVKQQSYFLPTNFYLAGNDPTDHRYALRGSERTAAEVAEMPDSSPWNLRWDCNWTHLTNHLTSF